MTDSSEIAEVAFDASDPVQVNNRKREAGRKKAAQRQIVKELMNDQSGRAWLWQQMEFCNVFAQTFVIGSPDGTAFNEGTRRYGNKLLTECMGADPEAFIVMMREHGKNV